jgi:predicted DNA-binding transcriptional regulator YafY
MRLSSRPPLARLAVIDREVRRGGLPNASTLAKQLDVSHRTIQRDITFLRDRLGAPLIFDSVKNGYHYGDANYRFASLQLTEGELLSIFLAERLLQQYRDTPYAAALATAFRKIADALVDEVTIDLSHFDDAVSFRQHTSGAGGANQFGKLHQAVADRRQLELVYWTASRDETSRRIVDPYHLASIDGDWFLIGYCHLREDVRMFAPSRIRSLRETGASFEPPLDFRVAEYLDVGFRKLRGAGPAQTVRLRFAPTAARYVREKAWHSTQRLEELPNGALEMTLRVNHLLEVKRWVLSWGSECEVLGPRELRDEIQNEIVLLYQRGNSANEQRDMSQ